MKKDPIFQKKQGEKYIPYVSSPGMPFSPKPPLSPGVPEIIKCLSTEKREEIQ